MKKYKATVTLEYSQEDFPEDLNENYVLELATNTIANNNFEIEVEEIDEDKNTSNFRS